MPLSYKAEQLSEVLNDAKEAKPIEGMDNTYDPENYTKLFRANTAIAELESTDFLVPQIDYGAFEWDKKAGRPKSIARYRPAMLDLHVLTMNLYKKFETIHKEEYEDTVGSTDKNGVNKTRKVKKTRTTKDVTIKVIFGRATVQAIRDMKEIGNAVKAQVFEKKAGMDEWVYKGAELVQKDDAYKFSATLDVNSAMKLMNMVNERVTNEQVEGDSLDGIA